MDACTASTCDKLWGRNSFAKVLVNVWSKGALKREIEVVIPRLSGEGEDVVKVVVEYDWEPSQCSLCKVFGHSDVSCGKRVATKEDKRLKNMDSDGFQQPKRKIWKPKARREATVEHQAESSKVKGKDSSSETMLGVGTIKQVQVEPIVAPIVHSKEKPSENVTILKKGPGVVGKPNGDAGFYTVNAGRTPVAKETIVGPVSSTMEGPELVKSVVQAFKHTLQPRRGVVINENRFAPLSSDEESDDEGVEDLGVAHSVVEEASVLGAAPSSISQ